MLNSPAGSELLVLAPASQTNSATRTANIDTRGADYCTVRIVFASELNTNAVGPTISLQESDDTVVTNFATIVANRTNEDLTAAHELAYHVDLRGRKRYLRLSVTTATATNDNITMGAVASLTRLSEAPSNAAAMSGSTNESVVVV